MNSDFYFARLDRLLEEYTDDCVRLESERKPNELFGLKLGSSDNPRHERFAGDVEELLRDFKAQGPDSAALRTVLETLFEAPEQMPRSAYWMRIAVQGLTRELIPGLDREDAAALAKAYKRVWPRHMRLPVQDEVLKLLQKAAE